MCPGCAPLCPNTPTPPLLHFGSVQQLLSRQVMKWGLGTGIEIGQIRLLDWAISFRLHHLAAAWRHLPLWGYTLSHTGLPHTHTHTHAQSYSCTYAESCASALVCQRKCIPPNVFSSTNPVWVPASGCVCVCFLCVCVWVCVCLLLVVVSEKLVTQSFWTTLSFSFP